MSKFWEKFTYRIKIDFYYPKTKEEVVKYVTEVRYEDKTFKFHSAKEIEEDKNIIIQKFTLEQAVDLMNRMFVNGYRAAIEPWF